MKVKRLESAGAMLVIAMTVSTSHAEPLAHWRFEEVLKQDRSRSALVVGESLTGRDNQAVNPHSCSCDESGLGNGGTHEIQAR